MADIGIGIKVGYTEVTAAKSQLDGLKQSLEDAKENSDFTFGADGNAMDGATRGAREFKNELESASDATGRIVKDYDKLIKLSTSASHSISGFTGPGSTPGIGGVSAAESARMRKESSKDAAAFWAESEKSKGSRSPTISPGAAADILGGINGGYGGGSSKGEDGVGGAVLGSLITKLGPYAAAAYATNKMRMMWNESGGTSRRIMDSQIPLDKLGQNIPLQMLGSLNKRLLMDPLASLGMFNIIAHTGLASKGTGIIQAGSATAERASATALLPEEMAQKQSAIGQHMQNLSFTSGQSQSDIIAQAIIKTDTRSLAPRLYDATIRLLSAVGTVTGRKDMTDAKGNKMSSMMAGFWEYGTKTNSQFFMGGGIENLYAKAAGSIARGGGDPNTKMFMARALGANKTVTNLDTMWAFKQNMEDASNPENQRAMAKEAMRMATSLGLKGKEAAAFSKMQLHEAYGGNMTTSEIDILMSPDYNSILGKASAKTGKQTKPPTPKEIADASPGMVLKADEGNTDIEMAGTLGQRAVGLKAAINSMTGTLAKSINNLTGSLDENTQVQRDNIARSHPKPTEEPRYRVPPRGINR